ncbi:phosphoprotein phosphatase [Salinisphaera sp. T5B8]
MTMGPRIQYFDANTAGRDFVVGDIHGCFYMLDVLLERLAFDTTRDRLFSVGDLIDRGPDSERAGEFIDAPWFHAIRGNHEQMLLDAVDQGGQARALWHMNGGDWFDALDVPAAEALTRRVRALPLAAEVAMQDGRLAGLVHAEVWADSWAKTRALLEHDVADTREFSQLLWNRDRASAVEGAPDTQERRGMAVDEIDVVYFGHTPMRDAIARANTRWLDTGAFMGWRLSVAELGVHGDVWSLPADLDDCRQGWRQV